MSNKASGMRSRMEEGTRRAGDGNGTRLPEKRFFRQRAHANPLSFAPSGMEYPVAPERFDWSLHYPLRIPSSNSGHIHSSQSSNAADDAAESANQQHNQQQLVPRVEVADIGCGFGGLLVGLAPVLPQSLCLGVEIRGAVTEYVRLRILALRKASPGVYDNISVLKNNTMKYLLNFVEKGQLSKMFFCFPDPHFKKSKHRRRIVSTPLLAEYAYFIRPGGRLYTITDVLDLHNWMAAHCHAHPAFERIPDAELAGDPCVEIMRTYTEEGRKVERMSGAKYIAVFRRLEPREAVAKAETLDFWTEPHVAYEQIKAPLQAGSKLQTVPGQQRTKRVKLDDNTWGTAVLPEKPQQAAAAASAAAADDVAASGAAAATGPLGQ